LIKKNGFLIISKVTAVFHVCHAAKIFSRIMARKVLNAALQALNLAFSFTLLPWLKVNGDINDLKCLWTNITKDN
jgi:hypothetical protein